MRSEQLDSVRENPTAAQRNRNRRLHILDPESQPEGDPRALSGSDIRQMVEMYRALVRWRPGERSVIVSPAEWRFPLRAAWPGATLYTRSLEVSAPRALLACIDADEITNGWDEVWLGSSDGRFTGLVRLLRYRGLRVVLVGSLRRTPDMLIRTANHFLPFTFPGRASGHAA